VSAPATLVLDSEGLSRAVTHDRRVMSLIDQAYRDGTRVVASAATLVEARHPKISQPRFDWAISRLDVEHVTERIARAASKLLAGCGLHGHKYAIDAMVAATALSVPGPTVLLTSDPEDLTVLCGPRVRIIKV
jgi:predicted nucleic acid-binding protein